MRISDWSSDVCSSDLRRGRHQRRARLYAAKIHREDIEMVGGGAERDRARLGMSSPGNSRRTGRGNDNPADGFPLRSAAFQIFASISQAVELGTGYGAPDPGAALSCLLPDRKSVESGKGVAVRVDLRVRRRMKKNKPTLIYQR